MKRLLLSMVSCLIALSAFAVNQFWDDSFGYAVLDEETKTCELVSSSLRGDGFELVIPEKVQDESGIEYTVVSIGDKVFGPGNVSPTAIQFPSTLQSIGDDNFSWILDCCSSIEFPDALQEIGNNCFQNCYRIQSLVFPPNLISIGDNSFTAMYGLSAVVFSGSVTTIGDNCFTGSEVLSSIAFHQGVSFGEGVGLFEGDKYVEDVEITIYLNDIDSWAQKGAEGYTPFWYNGICETCANVNLLYNDKLVTSFTAGSKISAIAPYAFAGSTVEKVSFSEYLREIGRGAFAFSQLSSLDIPEGLTTIGDRAFEHCKNLQTVSFASTIETIGAYAFMEDISLYSVELPVNLKILSTGCFKSCSDLETVIFNEGLIEIGNEAFNNCQRLILLNFPQSLEYIGDYAFVGMMRTGDLKFGERVHSIGNYAFANPYPLSIEFDYDSGIGGAAFDDWALAAPNNNLLTITLPESLRTIGDYAFAWQPLREIKLPSKLETLGEGALCGTMISSVAFPSSITTVSAGVCAFMKRLTNVVIPEGISTISAHAFKFSPVGKLELPSSLRSIGNSAFYYSSLTNCIIPQGVTDIEEKAFYDSGLINCTVPNSVTTLGNCVFGDINCMTLGTGVTAINQRLARSINVLEMLSPTPPTLTNDRLGFTPNIVIVPEGAGDAYTKNNRWKDYNISARNSKKATVYVSEPGTLATELRIQTGIMPALVTNLVVEGTINDDDFAVMRSNMTSCYDMDLSGLTNKVIPANAFSGKTTLLELTLPRVTEEIGDYAFNGCSVLHLTGIPSSLTSIGAGAFNGCSSMDLAMKFPATLKTVGEGAFYGCTSAMSADFSACSDMAFGSQVFYGCRSLEWATLPNDMTSVPYATFNGAGLLSVNLPESLQTIEGEAFANSGLQSVEIPEGVTLIDNNAFSNTASLKDVTFPSTLETIGNSAFEGSDVSGAMLPATLRSMGEGAFANSSLSYVTFGNGITEIPASAFEGCPYLMFVNLPNTLTALNQNSLAAPALAAISSPTIDPAATFGAPFTGVDNYTCALSIPKPSYSKYLQAEYWGAFVGIRNCIDVEIPEALEVTYIDEEDYQALLEELEEETPEEVPADVRRRALRAMAKVNSNTVISGVKFAHLFNNASLYVEDNSEIRYFLPNVPEGVNDIKILYNNRDITSQLDKETMSFVCPPLTSSSTLVIESAYFSGVENVAGEGEIAADAPVYDLTGAVVGYGAETLNRLPAGIYIVAGKKVAVK